MVNLTLTNEQFYLLNIILDNHSYKPDAFFDKHEGTIKSYDEKGKEVFLTPQEYINTRLVKKTLDYYPYMRKNTKG